MDANIFTSLILPLALGVIMLGMGMSLTPADFSRVLRLPKAALVGLANQLLILPILGLAVVWVFALPAELAVGLMILAACPGGPTSNLVSHLARGDTALSITLTAISSFVTVMTIPLITNLSLGYFLGLDSPPPLPLWTAVSRILIITLVPVAIGMTVNRFFPRFTSRSLGAVNLAAALFFVLVIGGAIYGERDSIPRYFQLAGWAALTLNVTSMAIGMASARGFGLPRRQAWTIAIESGLQNGTLAITVAASPLFLGQPALAIPAAIYSLLMFATAAFAIGQGRRG